MTQRPRRSALYVPASNPRAMAKAPGLGSDVIILDLEDAVAPQAKDAARKAATEALVSGRTDPQRTVLRVNGLDTAWGMADLAAAREARPFAILAPKVNGGPDAERYAEPLGATSIELWTMVETCHGVMNLDAIARASLVSGLVFGSNDLLAEMGAAPTRGREPLTAALSASVMAARAYGLTVLDGVYNDVSDPEGLRAECEQAAAFGFDGKTLIHPSQIPVCHTAFAPNPKDVSHARAVVAAFASPENSAAGVLSVEGRMTERLHLARAMRLLAIHDSASGDQSP